MSYTTSEWIIKSIFLAIVIWLSIGSIALLGFVRCQYRDSKIVEPRTDPWSYFGVESVFMLLVVALFGLFQIITWPDLIRIKRDYERGVYTDFSLT